MDVTCKCGHNVDEHGDWKCSKCNCELGEVEVYQIFITEQQARLDTLRMQVDRQIEEKKIIKKHLDGLIVACLTMAEYAQLCISNKAENNKGHYRFIMDKLLTALEDMKIIEWKK